ncbi:MAG: IS110 family transposase [Anaerolineales bacterium]|nr:IS110 family transposase [Anaerolineales bacterium]
MNPTSAAPAPLGIVHPHAAGLDIGQAEIWAAVPAGGQLPAVRAFGTFTPDLQALADWLVQGGITTVALESTGVYWIPIFELLEARGLEVCLVNARHIKNVPGRKSDVQDCQWLQQLHRFGLLRASFRPEAEVVALRAYLRHRAMLLEHRAAHTQHMQKALLQMNLRLTQVLSDVTGTTGLAIIRAIVGGERNPRKLAQLRHGRCQHPEPEIAMALTGSYRPEHVFALKQALALYDAYTAQLADCDREIEQHYATLKPRFEPDDPDQPLGPDEKPNTHSKNAPDFDVRRELFQLVGVDLTVVPGLHVSSAQQLLAEIGTDLSKFPTVKHFCSWLGLAPHNDITGGKVKRARTLPTRNRAGQVLRLAAQAVGRGRSGLGTYYRAHKLRLGAASAITATAHKLARIVYHMLKDRQPYQPLTKEAFAQQRREREVRALTKQAAKLGLTLQPQPA